MNRPIDIFAMAMEFKGDARAACLDRVCGDDAALRAEVESLLEAHDAAGAFLDDPARAMDAAISNEAATARARRHAPSSEQSGQMIGRYKLLQSIGEGGFGSVWMAEQKEPVKRRVALKIIKLGMDTKQVIARFEAERQALAMMDHPNIAKVLDAGATDSGRPFFVMELINGVPILQYCDTQRLDTRARLDLFIKVCNAIQHAHQKGVIHRDIKPGNVMITLHDGVPVPKVIDFGIAKATNQELTDKTLFTQHQQMIGTPAYMSPEQAEMSGLDIDTRSDIYSLGVLLYELLTGTTPFNSDELMSKGYAEMMRVIRETEPDRPSTRLYTLGARATRTAQQRCVDVRELGSVLRGDLDWIIMKCLEKDRSRRYDTANGLAVDIQRYLDDEPVTAGPPSATYRLGKFVKRNRAGVIAAALVATVLVLGTAGTTGGMLWALDQKARAELAEQEKERELNRATEVKRLISEMLGGINPEVARGQDTTLLRGILNDTAQRLDRGEIKDELIAAELHLVIGQAYLAIGMWDLAEQHIPGALEIRTRLLGEDDPATLDAVHALIALRGQQGQGATLEEMARTNLERRQRVLGREHRDTLSAMAVLANVYGTAGRADQADPLARETLVLRRRVLGDDDPDTLESMIQVATAEFAGGRIHEAATRVQEVLDRRIRLFGENDPATLISQDYLARLRELTHDYEAALALRVKTVEIAPGLIGEANPHTLNLRSRLAALYVRMGRYEEACPVYETDVRERRRIAGGFQRPPTWAAMKGLGMCYEKLGRAAAASDLYRELLDNLPADAQDASASPMQLTTVAWVHLRPIEEVCNPIRALQFALRAVELVQRRDNAQTNPQLHRMLDILATAQDQTGDTGNAIKTERLAIASVQGWLQPELLEEYQSRLEMYEAALAKSASEANDW